MTWPTTCQESDVMLIRVHWAWTYLEGWKKSHPYKFHSDCGQCNKKESKPVVFKSSLHGWSALLMDVIDSSGITFFPTSSPQKYNASVRPLSIIFFQPFLPVLISTQSQLNAHKSAHMQRFSHAATKEYINELLRDIILLLFPALSTRRDKDTLLTFSIPTYLVRI